MFTMLAVALIFSISISSSVRNISAEGSYSVGYVDHTVTILENGYTLINDTITLSGQAPPSFLLGLPYAFGPYVVGCVAVNANNNSNTYPVSLSEPLEGQVGFYGIKVDFSNAAPQNFSVQVLLSNALVSENPQNASEYTVTFPTFPSLVTPVDTCNGSIVLPADAVYVQGTINSLTYSQANLAAFTYNSSSVTFTSSEMQLFDVNQLRSDISINGVEGITGTDTYYVTNKGNSSLSSFIVLLPPNATNVNGKDQFGVTMTPPTQVSANSNFYTVTLATSIDLGDSSLFTVTYGLPSGIYLEQQAGANSFALSMTMFQGLDYYVNETTVSFVLPEGATLQSFESSLSNSSYSISKGVYQEGAVISMQGVTLLDSVSVTIVYNYSPLWSGFLPTIWVLALAMIGCFAVVILRRPKAPIRVPPPTAGLRVRPEFIRSFVETYEEKMKIVSEINSLESRAQKGRLPRRRYKVQRRTLETRLETLSRSLAEDKERMISAGGQYASLMRELEVAETGMNEYEANVKTIEARHSRGELSLEAYRKLLGDYQHRKERNETTINGILLRLREEIR